MKLNSNNILKIFKVLTWIGFIGICIKTGAIIYSFLISLFSNPIAAKNLYSGLDLSYLKNQDNTSYTGIVLCIIVIHALQALMFFYVITIFKKINMVNPFHETIEKLMLKLSLLAFIIGVFSKIAFSVLAKYNGQSIHFPQVNEHIGQGDAFVFFAGILFFISVLYKRGIELQAENDLTI